MKHLTPENLTIIITTYNQLGCLKLSIYSFLELYPLYRKCIKVFDDGSSSEISTWLRTEGIQRITWQEVNTISDYSQYTKTFPPMSMSLRNSFMLSEILRFNIYTQYVMINDNDLIFLKGGFIEKYDELIDQGYKAIAPFDVYQYAWEFVKKYKGAMLDLFLGKFKLLYNLQTGSMRRLHWCHGVLDQDYFKSLDIYFDDSLDKTYNWLVINGCVAETGSELFYQIEQRGIKYWKLDNVFNRIQHTIGDRLAYPPIQDADYDKYDIYHMRWMSSAQKITDELKNNLSSDVKEIKLRFYQKVETDLKYCTKLKMKIESLAEKYNIDIQRIKNYD